MTIWSGWKRDAALDAGEPVLELAVGADREQVGRRHEQDQHQGQQPERGREPVGDDLGTRDDLEAEFSVEGGRLEVIGLQHDLTAPARERLARAIAGLGEEHGVARLCGTAALATVVTAAIFVPHPGAAFPPRELIPVIPLLVPLALRGVRYRPAGATVLLRRNLLIYGLGGLITPFAGIKLIDLVVHGLLGA